MCVVKTPKITAPSTAAQSDKPLPVLRNPYLDGIGPTIRAQRTGMSSLRIDRGTTPKATPKPTSVTPTIPSASPATPTLSVGETAALRLMGPAGSLILKRSQAV